MSNLNWQDLLKFLVESGLLGTLVGIFIKYLKVGTIALENKTHNDKLNKYIDTLENSIESAVVSVNQTFVDELKKNGNFSKEAQAEAFEAAQQKVLISLSNESKTILSMVYGDINNYIVNRIDFYIKKNKN